MKRIITLLMIAGLIAGAHAQTELIISEYVEGWSNNKALEIYNPNDNAVDLSEFRIVRFSNGEDVPPADPKWTVNLPSDVLEAYHSYVIVIDQRDPEGTGQDAPVWSQLQQRADAFLCPEYEVSEAMYFNGDDAIVIQKDEGGDEYSIHDIFGRWGPPAPAIAQFVGSEKQDNAWTDTPPYVTGEGLAITAEHTMIRKPGIASGVTSNPALFNPLADWDTLPANTFYMLGWHDFDNAPANETPVLSTTLRKFAISPSATNGTEVVAFEATDAEEDELEFYLDYGNFIYIEDERVEPFSLDKSTGVLSLVDETGLAPDILDTFNITMNITDGFSQLGPVYFKVIVTDEELGLDQNTASTVVAYPNPVADNHFRIQSDREFSAYEVSNVMGQTVLREELSAATFEKEVIIVDSTPGIYFIKIWHSSSSVSTIKLLFE